MHTKDACEEGETEQRLHAAGSWDETLFFTERERGALAWTEAVTLVGEGHVPDNIYEHARHSFGEKELIDLTLAVIVINGWNRLAINLCTASDTHQLTGTKNVKVDDSGFLAQ